MATWEMRTKKIRGKARKNIAPEFSPTQIQVLFDEPLFSMRTGQRITGKTYDSMEEALDELGEGTIRSILEDGQTLPVRVNITIEEWRE